MINKKMHFYFYWTTYTWPRSQQKLKIQCTTFDLLLIVIWLHCIPSCVEGGGEWGTLSIHLSYCSYLNGYQQCVSTAKQRRTVKWGAINHHSWNEMLSNWFQAKQSQSFADASISFPPQFSAIDFHADSFRFHDEPLLVIVDNRK